MLNIVDTSDFGVRRLYKDSLQNKQGELRISRFFAEK